MITLIIRIEEGCGGGWAEKRVVRKEKEESEDGDKLEEGEKVEDGDEAVDEKSPF